MSNLLPANPIAQNPSSETSITQEKSTPTETPSSATATTIAPSIRPIVPRLQHLLHQTSRMSHTTSQLTTPPAPWLKDFQEHLSKMPSPEFALATLHPTPADQSKQTPTPFVPRLRFCIYRGMWSVLPENKHNDAPQNPRAYESDMPTFTTDVRMEKIGDFFATSEGGEKANGKEELMKGSGGGGAVEAVWWIKDVGVQWRVRGRAYVVGEDIDWNDRQGGKDSSGIRTVKSAVGERMRIVDESKRDEWSWQTEVTAHFGNCSPGMRGSWKNPPPGTPTHGKEPDKEHQLGQKVEDLHDPIARSNFRVVVIKPDEVESLNLSDPATARRRKYTFVVEKEGGQVGEEKGEWKVEELWP